MTDIQDRSTGPATAPGRTDASAIDALELDLDLEVDLDRELEPVDGDVVDLDVVAEEADHDPASSALPRAAPPVAPRAPPAPSAAARSSCGRPPSSSRSSSP
ncbi:hypothetical protein [Clavibacter zhangzhiyongii]|uniref:hypothetical protein n=1 Tax=Clavibacter zhangzhiyongii TaxID=2768071 RepID=UPI0039E080F9